jgi:hypothetical protein
MVAEEDKGDKAAWWWFKGGALYTCFAGRGARVINTYLLSDFLLMLI